MNTTRKSAIMTSLICLAIGAAVGVAGMKLKAGTPEPAKPATPATNQSLAPLFENPQFAGQGWDPSKEIRDMRTQMDRMQAQMDKMFDQMSAQFRGEPQSGLLPDNAGYSLSLNVENLKNRYVVRAFLPDTKLSDVNVKLENDRTLQVGVSNQQIQTSEKKNEAASVSELGQYEQSIQLPSPVKPNGMKVVRNEHELLITLPKA